LYLLESCKRMSTHSADNPVPSAGLCKLAEGPALPLRDLYDELCALDNLRLAYKQITKDSHNQPIDKITLETFKGGVERFLQQLSNDLQARKYKSARRMQQSPAMSAAERGGIVAVRDLVVQAALQRLLESAFPPAFPGDPEPEKANPLARRKH
jgi:hypothetical protein